MDISLANSFSNTKTLGIKVGSVSERSLWNYYVKGANQYDVYHTYDYHLMNGEGDPILFIYQEDDGFLSLPLIKRKIEQTPYFDCTSVYGYTGALTNLNAASLVGTDFMRRFSNALKEFLLKEGIVCCFSVLHPLFKQKEIFKSIEGGSIQEIGKTVAIDLQISLEEQRLRYRRPIRLKIKQLRRKGFEVYQADSDSQVKEFIAIYHENMLKVGASSKYLFEDSYFEHFMHAVDFKSELLLAYHGGKIVAGAMVAITNDIVQLHLAGTRNEFLKDSPMKLIFDEAALLGRAEDAKLLHLGSGVGGKEDSLFHFKTGFSDNLFDFSAWQFVVNEVVYNELVQNKLKKGLTPNPHYFPLYRSC